MILLLVEHWSKIKCICTTYEVIQYGIIVGILSSIYLSWNRIINLLGVRAFILEIKWNSFKHCFLDTQTQRYTTSSKHNNDSNKKQEKKNTVLLPFEFHKLNIVLHILTESFSNKNLSYFFLTRFRLIFAEAFHIKKNPLFNLIQYIFILKLFVCHQHDVIYSVADNIGSHMTKYTIYKRWQMKWGLWNRTKTNLSRRFWFLFYKIYVTWIWFDGALVSICWK